MEAIQEQAGSQSGSFKSHSGASPRQGAVSCWSNDGQISWEAGLLPGAGGAVASLDEASSQARLGLVALGTSASALDEASLSLRFISDISWIAGISVELYLVDSPFLGESMLVNTRLFSLVLVVSFRGKSQSRCWRCAVQECLSGCHIYWSRTQRNDGEI